MKCKSCSEQIRMIIYKYLNTEQLREEIENLPCSFECSKKLKMEDDGDCLKIECPGILQYITIKHNKFIAEVVPAESPLKQKRKTYDYESKRFIPI